MLEQSLMHNRRRNDLEDIPKTKKVKPDTTLDDSVSTAGRQYSKSEESFIGRLHGLFHWHWSHVQEIYFWIWNNINDQNI